ncbi:MAG: VCBS repeat-containing protein [Ignavibacteriae bacterium]|nr:VCBS repeat-containing protein [Ignavibacteria bacterium]MBI3364081.1 VCBS repeat-containing protein [Ignavibacteriota bacterium]
MSLASRCFFVLFLTSLLFSSYSISQIPVWRRHFYSQGEAVGINPKNPATIFAQAYDGKLSVSHDHGETWAELTANIPFETREIIVHPNDTLVMFAVNFSDGLWRSTNGGSTFTKVLDNYGIDGESVVLDPSHPDTMYAGNFGDGGVFRSTDRGATWAFRSHAGTSGNLCALVARPDSVGILYAGTGAGTMSKSTNGGLTWKQVKTGGSSEIPKMVINPNNPMIAYGTGYEGNPNATGVWKTTDGGEHWSLTSLQFTSVWGIDIDPIHPDTVYAGSFDDFYATVYRTTNGGTSWDPLQRGFLPFNAVWNLKIDPVDPSNIYVGATYGAFGFDGIYKLDDANAGVEGYVFDSYTGQPLTNGTLSIQPLSGFVDLTQWYGRYGFYRFNPDVTSNQTLTVDVNGQTFHTENISLTTGSVLTQYIYVDPGSIAGQAFNDLNGNGTKDGGESGLSNWLLKLTGPTTATATTDINGNFIFHDLFPGAYTVTEQSHYGWRNTSPDPASYIVSVSMASKDYAGQDFGNIINHHVMSVSGGPHIPDPQYISIVASFDSAMNPATFNDSLTFIVRGLQTGIHRGSFDFTGGNTVAAFTSSDPFYYGEEYTVEMTSGLQVQSGLAITPYIHHFQVPAPASGGGFLPKVDYATGSGPWGVAIADVDGDGDNDIVTADVNADVISVLHNNGNGTFASKVDYATGASPRSVALGDVDNDGDIDVVAANNGFSTVSVLKNDGVGGFSSRNDYSAGGSPSCVALADINGVGSLDIVTALANGNAISILKNNGTGGYSSSVPYVVGLSPWWVAAGDVDGDGGIDLAAAVSNSSGTVSVLANIGQGAVQNVASYNAGSFPRAVAIADLDNDGRPDIVVANSVNDNVMLYRQQLDGSFLLQTTLSTPRGPWAIATGDIDGDGLLDICVVNAGAGNFSYFRNMNSFSFDARKDYKTGSSPHSIAIADIDGDGDQDVVVVNTSSNTVSVFRNVFTIQASSDWNLLSVPAQLIDYAKTAVYPSASSNTFTYAGNYVSVDTLYNGIGYWVKFDSIVDVGYNGSLLSSKTLPVNAGWNMIGSIGMPVSVTSIVSAPPGNVLSDYFSYDGSYQVADSLRPGSGYWVKTTSSGTLTLSASASRSLPKNSSARKQLDSYHALEFIDGKGHRQQLHFTSMVEAVSTLDHYELPPLPVEQSFDVRFASQRMLEAVPDDADHQYPILIQGIAYPLTVRWSIRQGDSRRWALEIGGKRRVLEGEGSLTLAGGNDQQMTAIKLEALPASDLRVPSTYILAQNYPNPFNPSTEIEYGLPVRSQVRMIVVNILGEVVDELMNNEQEAGYHHVSWTPQLPSGMYFYTLNATSRQEPIQSFVQTRKLILVK